MYRYNIIICRYETTNKVGSELFFISEIFLQIINDLEKLKYVISLKTSSVFWNLHHIRLLYKNN